MRIVFRHCTLKKYMVMSSCGRINGMVFVGVRFMNEEEVLLFEEFFVRMLLGIFIKLHLYMEIISHKVTSEFEYFFSKALCL